MGSGNDSRALSPVGVAPVCARRGGIVNTVKTAMQVANVSKLHAVIGGFHLGMAPAEYIRHTVDALAAMDPDVIIPMHCSGVPFIEEMRRRMPDRVVANNLGSRFTCGV